MAGVYRAKCQGTSATVERYDDFAAGDKIGNIGFDDNACLRARRMEGGVAGRKVLRGCRLCLLLRPGYLTFEENFETHFGQDYRSPVDRLEVVLSQIPTR
jgi:hypothetical protein